ncbi:MAG: dihydrodipicolinate synthase family protein [Caldilineaceae bacterium]|nr:dihydrodipicolinate synthase family protein [Caldilineaceae bacterium]
MNFRLQGVIVPLVTPFAAHGRLDLAAIPRLVNHLVDCGVAGLFPGGTTGEGFLLSLEERRQLAATVVDAAAGRVPVIVQTGTPTTAETLALTEHAQAVGAQAVAILPPYVYHHADAALLRHYITVAQSVPDLPIYLYNFPAISHNTLTTALILALRAEAPNIVGMKDSSGSLATLTEVVAATDGAFNAINGGDGQVLMALAMDFDGCVSGNANVVPELLVALYQAVTNGALPKARKLQQQLNAVRILLGDGGNLSLFKAMLARRGVPVGDVRAPLLPATAEQIAAKWDELLALAVF